VKPSKLTFSNAMHTKSLKYSDVFLTLRLFQENSRFPEADRYMMEGCHYKQHMCMKLAKQYQGHLKKNA